MNRARKIWFIIATSFIVIGCIIFGAVIIKLNWNFKEFNTDKYQENIYTMAENFNDINIDIATADIVFKPSDDTNCKVICYEQDNLKYIVKVENCALNISLNDQRKWYETIGISIGNPKITVCLPKNEYSLLKINGDTGDIEIPQVFKFKNIDIESDTSDVECRASTTEMLKIKLSTGDINLEKISASDLELSVTTGEVSLENVTCKNLLSRGDTGNLELSDVVALGKLSLIRTTGDINLDDCDAQELSITTDTGHVKGSLLTEKIFIANTDTGKISVPKTVSGGKCEITTDTGNIKIFITKR